MSKYILPELPFEYAALEPHISAKVMELHHDKHHRAYVDAANKAVEELREARSRGDFSSIAALDKAIAFNVSGHILHSIFWQNLSPDGGGVPEGELATAIARDFGSFEHFKKQMVECAKSTMGSGWAALVWEPVLQRLGTTQIHDHQSEVTQGSIPLMVLDAWEHAYYLQYQNEKDHFFEAVWNLWNWNDVAKRFALAQKVELNVSHTATNGHAEPALPH